MAPLIFVPSTLSRKVLVREFWVVDGIEDGLLLVAMSGANLWVAPFTN